ncbi:hypothetical protein HY745_13320, partial [Candidatus Desantisbacteria bacterium]|nr:hypothetical protein [Candidatus Desantisbacteria bacterium]
MNNKVIISPGAKIKALGTIDKPIQFMPIAPDWDIPVGIEINADDSGGYAGEFKYCLFGTQIIGINTPLLSFNNCTFKNPMMIEIGGLFPNPVKGSMKNSIVARGNMGGMDREIGYLYNLNVSYSLVPVGYKGTGEGIIWDYENFDWETQVKPSSTSPCINAGDPYDTTDPDGTRKDIGVYYFSLNDAVRVPQNYATIQEAIDAAKMTQTKVVIVSSGVYTENLTLPYGVRLMGESEVNKPIIVGTQPQTNIISIIEDWASQNTCLIENFRIERNGENKTGRVISTGNNVKLLLKNIDFDNCNNNEAVIYKDLFSSLNLYKINFNNNSNNGTLIYINYSGWSELRNLIKDCSFNNNNQNDSLINFLGDNTWEEFKNIINGNVFSNNSASALITCNTLYEFFNEISSSLLIERSIFNNNINTAIKSDLYSRINIESSTFYSNVPPAERLNFLINDNTRLRIRNVIIWDSTVSFTKSPASEASINYSDFNCAVP